MIHDNEGDIPDAADVPGTFAYEARQVQMEWNRAVMAADAELRGMPIVRHVYRAVCWVVHALHVCDNRWR